MLKVHLVAGARPNFVKVAPLHAALAAQAWCRPVLVHTGQHYDDRMAGRFLRELGLPEPDLRLHAGSGSHGRQTAAVMVAYEAACLEDRPDWVVVVGDVNSTLAAALTAKKLQLPVAHLEAGLRSRDRTMPEELNRVMTDAIADLLWTPSPDATENLIAEGIPLERIEHVGNIMIDALEMMRPLIAAVDVAAIVGDAGSDYGLITLHRPPNVDDAARLAAIVDAMILCSRELPLVFPVHPRTQARLAAFGLFDSLERCAAIRLTPPLGYLEFMRLLTRASLVITDSGGIQEETTYLGIPCLTLRPNTERPITIVRGTNRLVTPETLAPAVAAARGRGPGSGCARPALWDGRTAARVVASLQRFALPVSRDPGIGRAVAKGTAV